MTFFPINGYSLDKKAIKAALISQMHVIKLEEKKRKPIYIMIIDSLLFI